MVNSKLRIRVTEFIPFWRYFSDVENYLHIKDWKTVQIRITVISNANISLKKNRMST